MLGAALHSIQRRLGGPEHASLLAPDSFRGRGYSYRRLGPNLRGRRGLEDCSKDELLKLAEQDCFCGVTLFDPDAEPFPTASWPKEAYLFRFQPLITFPEPGWIEWQNAATCMIERAPSGAYEEDWRLQPGSRSFAIHLTERDAPTMTCLFVAGEHAIYARNRAVDLPSDKTLLELARDAEYDPDRLRQLVDCEFSVRPPRAAGW